MTNSPNMNLPLSTIGVDSGLTWETNLNNALTILDSHNHTPGNGAPIVSSSISINSAFPFNNYSATSLESCAFTPQTSLSTTDALYVSGVDLYYNDGNGTAIPITSGGAVAATSYGIASGTNSAAFVSSVLTVLAAATTPANISCASILLGNNSAGSHYLTLEPPAAMGANYTLTLPTIPASTSFMQMDTSGNMSESVAVSGGITSSNIAANGIARSNLPLVGQQISSSCNAFTTTSTSPIAVTNLTVTITTTGRPVMLMLNSDGSGSSAGFTLFRPGPGADLQGTMFFLRGTSVVSQQTVENYSTGIIGLPASSFMHLDTPAAGTYTYSIKVASSGTTTLSVFNAVLVAYEL